MKSVDVLSNISAYVTAHSLPTYILLDVTQVFNCNCFVIHVVYYYIICYIKLIYGFTTRNQLAQLATVSNVFTGYFKLQMAQYYYMSVYLYINMKQILEKHS